ncbi:MAG: hypothetical protein ACK53H_19480 [Betaproteobacteria bacterium]
MPRSAGATGARRFPRGLGMASAAAGSGEEFREHARRRLPPAVLAPLTRVNARASTWALLRTFGLLAAVAALAIAFWSWWAALLAIVLMAPPGARAVRAGPRGRSLSPVRVAPPQ